MNNDIEWWLSIRHKYDDNPSRQLFGDILYGVVKPFIFPKSHRKIELERWQSKRHDGLKTDPQLRLSHRLKLNGMKCASIYFKNYPDTVRCKVRLNKLLAKRRHKPAVDYGRRHELIMAARYDRDYRKHGPLGG